MTIFPVPVPDEPSESLRDDLSGSKSAYDGEAREGTDNTVNTYVAGLSRRGNYFESAQAVLKPNRLATPLVWPLKTYA